MQGGRLDINNTVREDCSQRVNPTVPAETGAALVNVLQASKFYSCGEEEHDPPLMLAARGGRCCDEHRLKGYLFFFFLLFLTNFFLGFLWPACSSLFWLPGPQASFPLLPSLSYSLCASSFPLFSLLSPFFQACAVKV